MHPLLRQVAAGKLSADPRREEAARDRHSTFYCAVLGRWGDRWNRGLGIEETVDLDADRTNVWTALKRASRQGNGKRIDLALDALANCAPARLSFLVGEAIFQVVVNGLTECPRPLTSDAPWTRALRTGFRRASQTPGCPTRGSGWARPSRTFPRRVS